LLMVLIYQKKHIGISGTKYQLVISGEIQRLTFGKTFSAEWIITGKLYNMYNRKDLWQKGDFLYKETSKQLTTGSNFVYYYFGYVCLKIRQLFSQFLKEKGEYYDSY
jgi:hypothetical protein